MRGDIKPVDSGSGHKASAVDSGTSSVLHTETETVGNRCRWTVLVGTEFVDP